LAYYIFALRKSGKWKLWQKSRKQSDSLFRNWRICCKSIEAFRIFFRKKTRDNC